MTVITKWPLASWQRAVAKQLTYTLRYIHTSRAKRECKMSQPEIKDSLNMRRSLMTSPNSALSLLLQISLPSSFITTTMPENLRQHAGQMRILLEYLDPKGDNISYLAQDERDAVWKKWVKPTLNSGSKKAGTVISYLTTFEKFLPHVTNPRYNHFIPIILASSDKSFLKSKDGSPL